MTTKMDMTINSTVLSEALKDMVALVAPAALIVTGEA